MHRVWGNHHHKEYICRIIYINIAQFPLGDLLLVRVSRNKPPMLAFPHRSIKYKLRNKKIQYTSSYTTTHCWHSKYLK